MRSVHGAELLPIIVVIVRYKLMARAQVKRGPPPLHIHKK